MAEPRQVLLCKERATFRSGSGGIYHLHNEVSRACTVAIGFQACPPDKMTLVLLASLQTLKALKWSLLGKEARVVLTVLMGSSKLVYL